MDVQDLADNINTDCENGDYFWAYGLIKESKKLWKDENKELLCETALTMLEQVTQ